MHDVNIQICRIRTMERLVKEALAIADDQKEHLISALLDEALHLVRSRLAAISD